MYAKMKSIKPINRFCSLALFHESLVIKLLAGLLTCSIFERPSRYASRNSGFKYCPKILEELTAAGLFRIRT